MPIMAGVGSDARAISSRAASRFAIAAKRLLIHCSFRGAVIPKARGTRLCLTALVVHI